MKRMNIGVLSKEGQDRARAEGRLPGRSSTLPPELRERIRTLRAEGLSLWKIAGLLNDEGIPTSLGGQKWYASTVRVIVNDPL
jgi:DNA invertase Pin-like site-specific DNA recombinase